MEGQPTAAGSKHLYQPHWPGTSSNPATPIANSAVSPDSHQAFFPSIDLYHPLLLKHQDDLIAYNKLVSSSRSGGVVGLQTPQLPPVISSPSAKSVTRSRSSSKVSNKDSTTHTKSGAQSGHGNRPTKLDTAVERAITSTGKESPSKMTSKTPSEQPANPGAPPLRPSPSTQNAPGAPSQTVLSSSVPSTPHQHARKFSFESREPSPGATQNHSPRSAYSEANGNVPSLRPLPPRNGGCRFETAIPYSRRRMPYSDEKLPKVDVDKIKSRLSDEEEIKLKSEMDDLYGRLLPKTDDEIKRQKLVDKLESLFTGQWPNANIKVHLFGSSGNLLCTDDSDVDICITTTEKDLENVCQIADLLDRHGMQKVVCVSSAKVPIVKIWDPELQLACDMNVNNTLALENTRMVRTYVSIDDRVRQLAMIIKYWTRRRVINDAAFGGTLSSYTWICMIIAFLQLREPRILPALHEEDSSLKLLKNDGTRSQFADDIKKLHGFGNKNTESIASLLFHFFRFYAHEFDYDKYVLSIRTGKLLIKTEKNWHIGSNNKLCVEEPFNTIRNLGNTADDFSFRGLVEEMQRAFRLIAEGKFEESCEEFVFPKEEEKKWERPSVPVTKPVLVRSASQQATRGGRNFTRRQFQSRGVQNPNRRASSSMTYDASAAYAQNGGMPPTMSPQDLLWYQVQNPQLAVSSEMLATSLTALAHHESNLRFQLYTQAHTLNQQQQLITHAQRMQQGAAATQDRSRTNSFDNPPLSAPIRQDYIYSFPYTIQQPAYFHPGYTTFPASPASTTSTANGGSDFRRSLQRTSATSDSGGGAMRSQSQPASRSTVTASQVMHGYPTSNVIPNLAMRPVNGAVIPSYGPGEGPDADFDKSASDSPSEDDGHHFTGYYLNDQPSPSKKANGYQSTNPTVSALSTSGQSRRRLSTEQSPQSVLDRRMKRTSRSPSPSPLGHSRAYSTGLNSAPLLSAPFPQTNGNSSSKPIMVNGTVWKPAGAVGPNRSPLGAEPVTSADHSPVYLPQTLSPAFQHTETILAQLNGTYEPPAPAPAPAPVSDRPVIVNGSITSRSPPSVQHLPDSSSFQQRMVMGLPPHMYHPTIPGDVNNMLGLARIHNRQQLASLDLATNDYMVHQEQPHLSPVYEHRTPSPTMIRKTEAVVVPQPSRGGAGKESRHSQKMPSAVPSSKQQDRSPVLEHKANVSSRENGHGRNGKSPTDHVSSWQKSKPRKKGGMDLKQAANGHAHTEQLPKNEADRKGG
ncbi:hypothetical protein QBC38DRAFT_190299 [Podospora fimiseda]|uniref:polynucleotide adenylyltransferase n=1 Tax=Podospora fimiseda TaxID=252190 RepID=A0AAN7BPT7_9PEZI|nr:hypothetical protein QBC38DRAFT_190299 [Podospora fimiseda]